MKNTRKVLGTLSMVLGLMAVGILTLALVTDYWLFTVEPVRRVIDVDASGIRESGSKVHSGLWRMCLYDDDPIPVNCSLISYTLQDWEAFLGADTTTTCSILRAIRQSSPFVITGLLLMGLALGLATWGHTHQDIRIMCGAVVYIFSALTLAIGGILYMSAVNDEVGHWKQQNPQGPPFVYTYGWAFFAAGAAFVFAMSAAVVNITLYLSRYTSAEDLARIIPGIYGDRHLEFNKTGDGDCVVCPDEPMLIM